VEVGTGTGGPAMKVPIRIGYVALHPFRWKGAWVGARDQADCGNVARADFGGGKRVVGYRRVGRGHEVCVLGGDGGSAVGSSCLKERRGWGSRHNF
jgi:hypothetical protein